MIPPFILAWVEGFVGPRFAKLLIYAVLIALLVIGFGVAKCSYDQHVIKQHEEKLRQQGEAADNQADAERSNDAVALNQSEQEMHNAISSQPDQPISPTSHALGCERLRRLGRDPAACR